MMLQPDPLTFFRMKPIRAARVSEISETTAAASVPNEERVNFHIGNPLQDTRLSSAFLRVALGIDIHRESLCDEEPDAILEYLGWPASAKPKLEFLIRTIRRSSPYLPRGGFSRKSPHGLIQIFIDWLEHQQEPLHYNAGEQSRREIILASGGIYETLRVLLFALSDYLEVTPARFLTYRCELLPELKTIPNLIFETLPVDESQARLKIEQILTDSGADATSCISTYLLIGDFLSEETRRILRLLSLEKPLFFIEANNAPNHLSLAREARLMQRVVRLLTPAIFVPRLQDLSTVFVVGNADLLSVIENVHFNLKGTPSASEIELLSFILEQKLADIGEVASAQVPQVKPSFDGLGLGGTIETVLPQLAARIEGRLEHILQAQSQRLERSLHTLEEKTFDLVQRAQIVRQAAWIRSESIAHRSTLVVSNEDTGDEFAAYDAGELLDQLIENIQDKNWYLTLQRNFLSAFVRHQPQYHREACLVASGSSRTALGILGFHCGIDEVVIPDLSWSYEQCFPTVHAVPLSASLELDVPALIAKMEELCRCDPTWPQRGALALNNPHNATGRIFSADAVRTLVAYCLQRNIFVVDDLSYQNVAPVDDLPEIKTARQVADELVRQGVVDDAQAERVITVHSMSKTDCLAGARLAVIEIRAAELRRRFQALNDCLRPNLAAIFICYLFYRGPVQDALAYWRLRNTILRERIQALLMAANNLPPDRNPFCIKIIPPTGSMYPLLHVERLPAGLSLDWLASSLARIGIGLLPLATFARTEKGFETGRTTFRLTLGGVDGAEILLTKTRRLLIDLNRLIGEEKSRYNRKELPLRDVFRDEHRSTRTVSLCQAWDDICKEIQRYIATQHLEKFKCFETLNIASIQNEFLHQYVPERLNIFRTRLLDRALVSDELVLQALSDGGIQLAGRLEREFLKDSLPRRQELFRLRCYDRTVHPTQMYSLQTELAFDALIARLISSQPIPAVLIQTAARELAQEYLGRNVPINSQCEADEILLDMVALETSEAYTGLFSKVTLTPFLSFWSDWDGSNRPSGQGHRLMAAVVMKNVQRLATILELLYHADPSAPISLELLSEINLLPKRNLRFTQLLNAIMLLTHQLEQRYRGVLPFSMDATPFQRLATRIHIRRDPARVLWQHNDRYERKMLELRQQRRDMLEYYFALNKQLRKQLHALIPSIQAQRVFEPLLREVVNYRDILQRVVITPRIHQGMITARDPFAMDTTVHNLQEINSIAGKYGNPGAILALQISLSSKPEALISLDRKMSIECEQVRRENPQAELPAIWLIPLFEDIDSVKNISPYLDRTWDYATQSRSTGQTPQDRFAEFMAEVFVAGSDLSQQVSQAAGAHLYLKAKYEVQTWLAKQGVAEAVRIKLGSGEPMQRQGGYYSRVAGRPVFLHSEANQRRFTSHLPAAARRSTAYAVTPLQGVFLGGDLRTFQSNLSEQMRFLPVGELAGLLYHVREMQRNHRNDLIRAAETIAESRLGIQSRSVQELERLTIGVNETVYEGFLDELSANFRHIIYGREEDVVGIHIISYFIGRSIPQLRDRPTSRRTASTGAGRSQQILANIAEIIPFARQGSLLRAIAHNQAQTMVLGINQLTTGLFRSLERYAQKAFPDSERERLIAERLLPRLPVYEILHTLRLYQDSKGEFLNRVEMAFPAGNSAFVALREDSDAAGRFLMLFQQELLRRHGVNVNDFFTDGSFVPDLLPTLRPDIVVLLQPDLFNSDIDLLVEGISGKIDEQWRKDVEYQLRLPQRIRYWRSIIWDVMGESLYQRVNSFTELATALYSFSTTRSFASIRSSVGNSPAVSSSSALGGARLPASLTGFLRTARADDEMRDFLIGAIEYLGSFTGDAGKLYPVEVPVSIIRAMNDVERIAQIEENALPKEKQDVIRCCILQIARLAGEGG